MSGERPPARAGVAIARGVGWKIATQLVRQITSLGVAIMLARLLNPFDFGVAALALAFTPLALVMADFGGAAALVQSRDESEEDRSTAFWISGAMGAIATGAGLALAGPIASFFGEPQVKPLFMVLSLTFFLIALTTTQSALLTRALRFGSMSVASMIAALFGAAVGVAVAVAGGGAWAIVLQQVGYSVIYLSLLWFAGDWRPKFLFSRRSAGKLVRFSVNLTGASFLSYVQKNLDNLLVGRILGATPLGVYSLSYNLVLNPATKIADPVLDAIFPVLARFQDDTARIANIFLRVVRITAAIVMPIMVGLVILTPEFVNVVLGEKWAGAVPVIRCLAGAGMAYALNAVVHGTVLAKGLTGQLFRYTLLGTLMTIGGLLAGLPWGVEGVAAGVAIAVLLQWPLFVRFAARALDLPMRRYWRNLLPVIGATGAMALAVAAFRLALNSILPDAAVLVVCVIAGAGVYLAACLLSAGLRGDLQEIAGVVMRRTRAEAASRAPVGVPSQGQPAPAPDGVR